MHGETHVLLSCITQIKALSTSVSLTQAGYAVIHLHRDSAVEPFTSDLPASSLLGLLKAAFEPQAGQVGVRAEAQAQISTCLSAVLRADSQHALLMVEFQNLFEYLQVRGTE